MKSLFTIILSIAFCYHLVAQPGTPDYSFGNKGRVISTTYKGAVYASLLQPDGKIVVGGGGGYYKNGEPLGGSLIVRYLQDGSLDLDFADSGRGVYSLGVSSTRQIYAMALQTDGKIVSLIGGYNSFAVMRINSNGTVDESFGEGGLALGPEEGLGYISKDMALLPDGRIVLAGSILANDFSTERSFITCFTPDGKPDESFGNDGFAIYKFSESVDAPSVAVTVEGKIIIGGHYFFERKIFLLRYNDNGTQDKTFGVNGVAEKSFGLDISSPRIKHIAIAGDGAIVTAGEASLNNTNYPSFFVNRFLSNGIPDSSFGTNGSTFTSVEKSSAYINSLAVQPNGKIVVDGYLFNNETQTGEASVARYDKDGILDSSFGTNGIQTFYLTGQDINTSVLIQKDGKIVTSGYGYVETGERYFTTLVRYYGDADKKQIIATRVRRWLQHHGITWQGDDEVRYYTVQRSTDGGITYQPVAKFYNNRPAYNYEEATAQNLPPNTCYRVAITAKNGERLYSNAVFISEAGVKVYPNPVRGTLQLQSLPANGKTSISILDLAGNIRATATASGGSVSINTASLAAGNYLLKLQHDNTITTQAFVKE